MATFLWNSINKTEISVGKMRLGRINLFLIHFWIICGLFFAVAILALILILVALLRLVITVRKLASDRIGPTVDTIQDLIVSIRATTDFVGEAVVSPIIRIYGIVSALKTLMFGANHLFEDERSKRGIPFEWKQLLRLLNRIFGSEKNE